MTIVRVSKLTYLLFLFLLGLAAGYGWLTYNDSSSLDASKRWCDDGLRGLKFEAKPARIDCHYEAFISMCVVDAFAAVGLLLLAVLTVLYKHNADPAATKGQRSKKAKKQRRDDDDNDDEDEEESDPLLNKAGNGVGTYVYEDFVTPKNRNSINTAYGDVSYDDDDDNNGDSSGTVDFDSESKKRYPQLEKQQQQQQQGNGDTQFEQVDEQPKKKQGGRKQQQEQQQQQVKRKESGRVPAKHSNPNDIDFSKLAEENEAASRKSGGGRVAQSGFQSALDMQAERTPPPQPRAQGQVRKKNSGVIGIQKQAPPPPPPQKMNNGDFDFESLEGNNGFEDD